MKYSYRHLFTLSFVLLALSCDNTMSLQRYFVDHQEAANFITQDIPISLLKIDPSTLTDKQKDAYQSVSRLNFLGYKVEDQNNEDLKAELATIKAILEQDKYNELIEFKQKGSAFELKYIGQNDRVDEFVLFGSDPERGFAVVRILGQDMTPEKMITLVEVLQSSTVDEEQIEAIFDFFK